MSMESEPPRISDSEPAAALDALAAPAERLAAELLGEAEALGTTAERRRQRRMHGLLTDPAGPLLAVLMADRTCRTGSAPRVAGLAAHLLEQLGIPRGAFAGWELAGLRMLGALQHLVPGTIAAAIQRRIRAQASGMLLDASGAPFDRYLHERHAEGVRVNVNRLGEALVGEREALRRVRAYCELAARPGVDAISVKISSIGSQLSSLAFERSASLLAERLGTIYDASAGETLVYLDMEAYEELELTVQAMERALSERGREQTRAGLVVQAYLPDAHGLLPRLITLSEGRVRRGATPLTLRIVKGANLATERVHASLMGWSAPTYPDKAAVDGSYRLLLERAMRPELEGQIRIGVASHNVFDLALALCLAEARGVSSSVHVELLEGMADPLRSALGARGVPTLVYAPVVDPDAFHSAVAYLVRRLDENADDSNFLRRAFGMRAGDPSFELERERFRAGLERVGGLPMEPVRATQPYADRISLQPVDPAAFENEPNTDFSSSANRDWARSILEGQRAAPVVVLQSQVNGRRVGAEEIDGRDPSRPGHVPYRVAQASPAMIEEALEVAQRDPDGWACRSTAQRAEVLRAVAHRLRRARGELLGLMLSDAGKALAESDPEVSEAIDFAAYYAESALAIEAQTGGTLGPRGVTLVASPWNFPLAIPLGGALAALASGNRVLLKPAPQTPWVATRLAELCWQAGVPEAALQLLLCDDGQAARLSGDARVQTVVLTGGTDTARSILRARPDLRLHAETGGKNALIVSAVSDREQAIHDAVRGAFGHAGQKCSATSLLICEAEVYDDPAFLETLADAAASLPVGGAYDPAHVVTPLIEPPSPTLERGLTRLEPGERWLVEPRPCADIPDCWSPGVRVDVAPGSFSHMHELFGPVLSVMRARDLAHAIELAQQPGYGLTAGLHSLDEREHAAFAARMGAGNLYINRTTTGAIVRRQPFGGLRLSSFGPGAKAGGPNYVLGLAELQVPPPSDAPGLPGETPFTRAQAGALGKSDANRLAHRERDYRRWWGQEFSRAHDPSQLRGEDNWLRYLPCGRMHIRVEEGAMLLDVASSILAATLSGCPAELSLAPGACTSLPLPAVDLSGLTHVVESFEVWCARAEVCERVRLLGSCPTELPRWAAAHDVHVARDPVHDSGRVELLHYLNEQALCVRYHRHGHLGSGRLRAALDAQLAPVGARSRSPST